MLLEIRITEIMLRIMCRNVPPRIRMQSRVWVCVSVWNEPSTKPRPSCVFQHDAFVDFTFKHYLWAFLLAGLLPLGPTYYIGKCRFCFTDVQPYWPVFNHLRILAPAQRVAIRMIYMWHIRDARSTVPCIRPTAREWLIYTDKLYRKLCYNCCCCCKTFVSIAFRTTCIDIDFVVVVALTLFALPYTKRTK